MEKLDKSLIPKGIYCYTWEETPNESNKWVGTIKTCPFYSCKIIAGVKVPWCNYLNLGGTDNNWKKSEWNKLKKHYKTDEEMDKELPLFLLFDSCKECGENLED